MNADATVGAALSQARTKLAQAQVPSPQRDGVLLLAHVLRVDAGEVQRLAIVGRALTVADQQRFEELVDERARRVPLQHLVGSAPFRRIELSVGPGVFVPRPETEVLTGAVIDFLTSAAVARSGRPPVVVDACTGSGAIALAIATEVPCARVIAVEKSPEALAWAQRNVEAICPRVQLCSGDVTDPSVLAELAGQVDVVAANPPYVPNDAEPVEPEVSVHDPAMALYGGGVDGLRIPQEVVARAAGWLRPGGLFVMEHADVQGAALVGLLRADDRFVQVSDHEDLTGRPRFVRAVRADERIRAEQMGARP